MDSFYKRLLLILSLLMVVSVLAFGQAETGQVVGTVADAQNAVVPNATVTIKNLNTTATRSTVSNASGLYTFTNLAPGPYEVTAEAANFTPFKKRLDVTVGSRNTVDFALQVKGEQTTVEVISATGGSEVEVTQQEMAQQVGEQQINELPTLTRNAYDLVGISGNVSNNSTGRGAGFNINGQRDASTDILLDGGENVDLFSATIGQAVPLDSIGEFKVITSNFSAEYGRASGGVVNVSSKTGTNAFHGTVFEFWRGAGPSSNTYDNNAAMTDAIQKGDCAGVSDPTCPGRKTNFVRNQFGYSVGGPILKDKLFFFSSTEWIRVRSMGQTTAWVVDPAWIANCGNFTDALACARVQSYYSAWGTLKPEATIFGSGTFGAVAADPGPPPVLPAPGVDYLQVSYPIATDAGGGFPENEYQSLARVDFNMTDKTQMYWRYSLQSQDFFPGANSESPYVGYDTPVDNFNNNFLWNVTHIWGPNVVSQSKFVFNRLNNTQPLNGPPSPNLYMKASTLQYYSGYPVAMPGYLPYFPGSAIPFSGPQNLYQFYQDLNWTHGKHQFRFGGQYVHTRDNRIFGAYMNGVEVLGSGSQSSNQALRAGNLQQFTAAIDPQGAFPCYTNQFGVPQVTPACTVTLPLSQPRFDRANRYHDFAFYAQDTWKIHPRLTLNLGVRWEYYGVQHNNDPSWDSNFYLGAGANYFEQVRNGSVMTSTDPNNPVGGLWEPDYNNWAPRIGFAWDIFGNGKTSLRGGYGISYERNFGNVTFNVIQNPPAYLSVSVFGGDTGCIPNCRISPDNLGPFSGGAGLLPVPKATLRAPIQDMQSAYAHFWSLSLEREIAKNTVLAFEYSGSRGVKQYSITNPNRRGAGIFYLGDNPADLWSRRLNDQYTDINARGQQGFSMYNALNIRVQSNNLHNTGLSFVSNYTWAHGNDITSSTFSDYANDFNLGLLNPFNPIEDKGDTSFDIRHRWIFSGTWDTPWFKSDQSWWKRNLLGGWTFAPIVSIQSGSPFTLWDCWNAYAVCPRWDAALAPNMQFGAHDVATSEGNSGWVGGNCVDLAHCGGTNSWDYIVIDPAAWTNYFNPIFGYSDWGVCGVGQGAVNGCPFPATMTGRNEFRRPGVWNMDLGLYKTVHITERFSLQLRGEAYNLFNHSNLYVMGGSADAANVLAGDTFAAATAVRGGTGSTGDRRNVQLGIKLIF